MLQSYKLVFCFVLDRIATNRVIGGNDIVRVHWLLHGSIWTTSFIIHYNNCQKPNIFRYLLILVVVAFFWLLSLLTSSLLWYAVIPLRHFLAFGTVFSVLFQEYFRYLLYLLLRKFEEGLEAVADDERLLENKHILAYVSGFGVV